MLLSVFYRYFFHIIRNASIDVPSITDTAQKVSVFGVFLIRNFPHSDQIQGFFLYFLSKCERLRIQKNFEYGHSLRSLMLNCIVISCFQVHITLYFKSHAETGTKLWVINFCSRKFMIHNVNCSTTFRIMLPLFFFSNFQEALVKALENVV